MSTILAIDTSTDRTSVAIVREGVALVELHHDDPLAHGEVLPQLIHQALAVENEIDLVAIGMGPGPFTGLRVGISFGQSFALARGIPWIGICSLDAIAMDVDNAESDFIVAIDARRKQLFWARFVDGTRIADPAVSVHQVVRELGVRVIEQPPRAFAIAQLAEFPGFNSVEQPIYVRRPDAYPMPAGVKIRAMNAMDLIAVHALEREIYSYEDPWSLAQFKEELAAKDRYYLVAEINQEIVGYAGVMLAGEVTDILTLTTAVDHRRKGIGREFLKRLLDWSRNKKVEAIMLEVRVGNTEAQPLYEGFGFRVISERTDYYGPGKTALVMRKELTS